MRSANTWGTVSPVKDKSGKIIGHFARYTAPDGSKPRKTFKTKSSKTDAQTWLAQQQRLVESGQWKPLKAQTAHSQVKALTVAAYAQAYIERREAGATSTGKPLAPKTLTEYRRYHERFIVGDPIADTRLTDLTVTACQEWRLRVVTGAAAQSKDDRHTGATQAARVYGFLKAVLTEAVNAELIARCPLREKGAGQVQRAKKVTGATDAEVARAAAAMPDRLRAAVYVAAYTGIRRSELRGLRRKDVDLSNPEQPRLHIRQQAQDVGGKTLTRDVKTVASEASAGMPKPVAAILVAHMERHTGASPDAYVFAGATGKPIADSVLRRAWDKARDVIGRRDDLDWHDLRHTGAMKVYRAHGLRAAQRFLRHSTPQATLTYLSITDDDLDNAVTTLGADVVMPTNTRHLRAVA